MNCERTKHWDCTVVKKTVNNKQIKGKKEKNSFVRDKTTRQQRVKFHIYETPSLGVAPLIVLKLGSGFILLCDLPNNSAAFSSGTSVV